MRVGLISDTHLPAMGPMPEEIRRAFAGVDLILHAGDIYNSECLDWLETIAPVTGVEVPPAPVMGESRVVEKRIVQIEGYSIGMVHDLAIVGVDEMRPGVLERHPLPEGRLASELERVFGAPVHGAVFGHSHWELAEMHEGILLVNPGSPTLPRQLRRLGTVGIMEVTPEGLRGEILYLKDFSELA